jgi:uncharacterized membrane protein
MSTSVVSVAAGRGWAWIRDGFMLFKKSPWLWIALTVIWLLVTSLLSLVPFIGALIAILLAPVFLGGFMAGASALDRGEPLLVDHLNAGFKNKAGQLIAIGAVSVVAQIAIMILVGALAFTQLADLHLSAAGPDGMMQAMRAMAPLLLIAMALWIPVLMLVWFAPPLLMFHDINVTDALKLSFQACAKNLLPFLVYGVIGTLLMFLVPVTFGLALLVLLPVLLASLYTSYKDLFRSGDGQPAVAAPG